MRNFFLFFTLQFLCYFNLVVNIRAIAHENYLLAIITDGIAPLMAWMMIRRITAAKDSWSGMAAVSLGGAAATVAGIWLTQNW